MKVNTKSLSVFLLLVLVAVVLAFLYTRKVDHRSKEADKVQDVRITKVEEVNKLAKKKNSLQGCWDLNGNGIKDEWEDVNGDGVFNVLDCRGEPGKNGVDGISCWDLNGNRVNDPEEDTNGDGVFSASDCQGLKGDKGDQGQRGLRGERGVRGLPGLKGEKGDPCTCEPTKVVEPEKKVEPKKKAEPEKKVRQTKVKKVRKSRHHKATQCDKPEVVIANDNSVTINGVRSTGESETPDKVKVGDIRNEGTLILNVNSVHVR